MVRAKTPKMPPSIGSGLRRSATALLLLASMLAVPQRSSGQNCIDATWCLKGDVNVDRVINLTDLPLFVNAVLTDTVNVAERCAADANLDTQLSGLDVQDFVDFLLSPDSDADGLPNVIETNNGVVASPVQTGTNPSLADTDSDGLRDGDELFCTLAGLNLRALGGSAVRRNCFVEVDWFDESEGGFAHSHRPTATAISQIVTAFANSPVTNPYGAPTGVTLIVDYGQGGLMTGGNLIPGGDVVVVFDSEFNTYKAAHYASNRQGFFHYSIFCHHYNDITNFSSGFAEILGDDFVVSLQTFLSESNVSKTMMHELGHNLNLRHGGNENKNFKPNYNSVMNYRYQFPGVDGADCNAIGNGILNYSVGTRITLNENNLDENQGVCGATAINWDGGAISTGVIRNINCDVGITTTCGTGDPSCYDLACNTLTDYNDWANIVLSGFTQGDFQLTTPEIISCQEVPVEFQKSE